MCLLFRDACVWLFDSLHLECGQWSKIKFSQPCYRGDHLSWSISSERLGSIRTDLCPRHFGYFHWLIPGKNQANSNRNLCNPIRWVCIRSYLIGWSCVFSTTCNLRRGYHIHFVIFEKGGPPPTGRIWIYGRRDFAERRLIPNELNQKFLLSMLKENSFLRQQFILRTD